jgi:DNA-binding NarL/FixJ family response regulator
MEVLTHPGAEVVAQEVISCLVMSAGDPAMHRRVEDALSSEGLEPRRHGNGSERIADGDLDASAIIVLVCNVDAPREMATLRRLRREWRQPPIVVISPPATGTGVRRALEAGADAFVFESNLELTLAATVRAVASGQSVVPRKVRGSLERPALSHRERQVLALVAAGLTNAQIAKRLFLSESTIKSHLSSVFGKLGVRSRWEAAALFLELEQATNRALTGIGGPATDVDGNGQGTA